jgi:hypothetical protein
MSDDRAAPPSIAEAMYPGGPDAGSEQARRVIESGIARPAEARPLFDSNGNTVQPLPRQPAPTSPPAGPAFDAARVELPQGLAADPQTMGEFSTTAKELGLSQAAGERLLQMHHRANKAAEEAYAAKLDAGAEQLARSFRPEHVQATTDLLNDTSMTPIEIRDWLISWGSRHPALATMLVNWATAINGRRY